MVAIQTVGCHSKCFALESYTLLVQCYDGDSAESYWSLALTRVVWQHPTPNTQYKTHNTQHNTHNAHNKHSTHNTTHKTHDHNTEYNTTRNTTRNTTHNAHTTQNTTTHTTHTTHITNTARVTHTTHSTVCTSLRGHQSYTTWPSIPLPTERHCQTRTMRGKSKMKEPRSSETACSICRTHTVGRVVTGLVPRPWPCKSDWELCYENLERRF